VQEIKTAVTAFRDPAVHEHTAGMRENHNRFTKSSEVTCWSKKDSPSTHTEAPVFAG